MCFSPKVKIPKSDPNSISAPTPAPLAEQVQGVEFGGSTTEDKEDTTSTSSEVKPSKTSGKSSLKIKLDSGKSTSSGAKRTSVKSRMGK